MTTIAADTCVKQPSESRGYSINFVNLLASGDSLASVISVSASPAGLTLGSASTSGTSVQFTISGGAAGVSYRIEAIVTTTLGETIEGDGVLVVAD